MIRSIIIAVTVLMAAVLFIGCQVGPNLSPMQLRQLTTRTIEGSYENVFKATMTVLQDQGYIIKNTDMNSGLLVAAVDRQANAFATILSGDLSTSVELTSTVNKINATSQDLRINIQETNFTRGAWGSTDKSVTPIYDEKIYQGLFNQILTEVKRREALQK